MSKIEKAISYMEAIARDNSHGYDQASRWGNPDFDCSALVFTAWENAGVPVKTYAMKNMGYAFTGNLYECFLKNGFADVTASIKLRTGKGLKRGDVLLRRGKHVAMYCGNGREVEASINEKGTVKGGKKGDQTGKEILIRSYRNFPWDIVLRYEKDTPVKSVKTDSEIDKVAREVIAGLWENGKVRRDKIEKAGYDYEVVQKRVNELLKVKGIGR